jgi:hypothetical protein
MAPPARFTEAVQAVRSASSAADLFDPRGAKAAALGDPHHLELNSFRFRR